MSRVASHGVLLLQRLHQLREEDIMCDVTVAVRDAEFRAHRNVLAAFSPYFSVYFSTQTGDKGQEVMSLDSVKVKGQGIMSLDPDKVKGQGVMCLDPDKVNGQGVMSLDPDKVKGQGVMSLDPDKVSHYALEKLLEFIYTGEMSSLVSDNLATVRSAAVFLGMVEATQYLEESPEHTKPSNQSKSELEIADLQPYNTSLHNHDTTLDAGEGVVEEEEVADVEEDKEWEEAEAAEHADGKEGWSAMDLSVDSDWTQRGKHDSEDLDETGKGKKVLACEVCGLSFTETCNLRRHMKTHSEIKPFQCVFCSKSFRQSNQLKAHMRIHTGEKPYVCDVCGQAFAQSSTLTYHKRRHTGEKPYQCDTCGMSFSVSSTLFAHARRVHGLKSSVEVSPEQERWSASLVQEEPQPPQHEKRSSSLVQVEPQPPQIKEEQEEVVVVVQEELDLPQIKQEPEELPLRPEETGPSTLLLQVKSEDNHGETEPRAGTSTEHMQTQAYIQYWQPSQPTTHDHLLSSHSSESENPYTCTICGKSFSENSNLRRHMRTHTGEKPYTCAFCGKGCSQMSELQTHMRIHTGEKPFICPICGKGCSERGSLKKHMRAHTGERPFICNVCGKGFGQTGNLKTHMRIHTGEKPFICNVCGKEFVQKGSLKSHMRTHKGVENL